jgi:hypothetical protein
VTSSSGIFEIIESSNPVTIIVDEIATSGFSGEARADFEAYDPLDEAEEDDIVDVTLASNKSLHGHHLTHVQAMKGLQLF